MAKRTAVPAPAAAIDDDLPWDKPKSDDETANLFDTGGERGLADDANDEPSELEDRLRASLASADDSDLPARPEDPTTEILEKKPVGEILTDIALQGISGRMRKKPLPAHSNEWVIATYRRMAGLREVTADQAERSHFNMDCTLLKLSADRRGISVDDSVGEPAASSDYEIVDDLEGSANTGQDLAPEQISTENILGVHEKTGALTLGVIVEVDVKDIEPDPNQARDEGADAELAESIKANGFYTNRAIELRVHPKAGQLRAYPHSQQLYRYMIVDGERRFRGAIAAGLAQVPATITDQAVDEGDRLIRQVVMNEGKRLKPMEEARTYKRIMAAKDWSIQQLADHLGKSKSTVSDRLALADVPAPFLPLFEKGELTTAAAPILRPLQGLPEKVIKSMIAFAREGSDWERAVNDGKPVPLKVVEQELIEAAREDDELYQLSKGSYLAKHYEGPSIAIGKERFATDMKEVDRLVEAETAELKAAPKVEGSKPAAPAPKPAPSTYQIAERKKARAAKAKAELRRAQFAAIAPKLPTSIGGSVNQAAGWSLFLVSHLVDELTNDTMRVACKALNLEPPKKGQYGGYNFAGALKKHAEKLSAPDRIRFALQLLMAADLCVSPYGSSGPKRLEEAAKLAGVDLKKVKVDDDREFPAGTAAKVKSAAVKKAAVKKPKKKTVYPAFMKPMQPSAALSAIVGDTPLPMTEVTKKVWQYIKRNGLQDPKERRMVNADEKLRVVFGGKKRVSMFEMTKLIREKNLKSVKG